MRSKRTSYEYLNGVEEFLEFAQQKLPNNNGIFFCPCLKCMNLNRLSVDAIRDDLICKGIMPFYTLWRWHGEEEEVVNMPIDSESIHDEGSQNNRLEDLIHDIGEENFKEGAADTMREDAETPLYDGCDLTRLEATMKLFSLKARHGWTDKSFTELLQFLSLILPKENTLPTRCYDAKKILCPLGLNYEKIHACPRIAFFIEMSMHITLIALIVELLDIN